jgi:ubiquinone/menaquinone biosynthesis C-methylase UbiE
LIWKQAQTIVPFHNSKTKKSMDNKNIGSRTPVFSGSIPKHYEQYQGPMFFEPYAIEISRRFNPSSVQVVLEIACGTGRITRHLREVIPVASKFVSSDISEDMLEVAKEKLNNRDIEWRIIDAGELPFDDNSIDLVVCGFGYMFVPDKSRAFEEAYRVLRPGGMLLFATWDKLELNGASYVYRKMVEEYCGDRLPETYHLAFSMYDEASIKESLRLAGFSRIIIEKVDKLAFSQSAKSAAFGLTRGGSIYNEIMKRNPAWIEEISARVEKELAEKFGAEPMIAPMRAVISQAWKQIE